MTNVPGPKSTELAAQWQSVMMNNYGTPQLALSHGKGARVWDVDGNEYLDLLGGIATSSLGHAHPAVAQAVAEQVTQLIHTSNLYAHQPGLKLARTLVDLLGVQARVFFCQDGATANEAAFKLARRHGWTSDPDGGRLEIVAATGSFHGRTMGALSITGSPGKRDKFVPLVGPVKFIPYGDAEALQAAVTDQTAAVFLETVQGEGGVIPAPEGYLAAARAACDANGATLVVDEVQSGIGRTGAWFSSIDAGVVPDVITLAKGLAGGMPLGAVLAIGPAGELFAPGDHGSTFGGNPVSCAAALAVINTIQSEDLLTNVKNIGEHWVSSFNSIDHPGLAGVRGKGLWLALELAQTNSAAVQTSAREHGFLVNAVTPDAIRLAPPLNLTRSEADEFTQALPSILTRAAEPTQ